VLGVDVPRPRFSWKLRSAVRGDEQEAYEICVVDRFNSSSVLWASGRVASANHTLVEYAGVPLEPFGDYRWSVRWWSAATAAASAENAQNFTMAPEQSQWAASEWVGGGNQLRSDFSLASAPVSATLCVAGLGLAQPWLNGQRAADHAMGPQSQLYTRVLYTSYDVTAQLKAGANAMGNPHEYFWGLGCVAQMISSK